MTRTSRIVAFCCFSMVSSLVSSLGFAWNNFGHMTVAAVAYERLTPAAHAQVTRLLQLNPNYPLWVSGVSRGRRDEVAFMLAATWADWIKSAPGYENDGEHPAGRAEASRNIGYSDLLQHRYWHYIDLPFSPDSTPLEQPVTPNALTQIKTLRQTLASPTASDELKSYDLVWLLHLVGDIHQPLHATSRFTSGQPHGDAGGNFVALCEKPCRNELHAFWDDLLGTSKKPDVVLRRAEHLPRPDKRLATEDDAAKWVDESFHLAETVVYVEPIGVGPGPFEMNAPYRKQAHRVARQQVVLAGARLARLLNQAFP